MSLRLRLGSVVPDSGRPRAASGPRKGRTRKVEVVVALFAHVTVEYLPRTMLPRPTLQLPAPDPDSGRIPVLIDTPKGSRNKYKYDLERGLFSVSRILPEGLAFPHDFGSIPGTCA